MPYRKDQRWLWSRKRWNRVRKLRLEMDCGTCVLCGGIANSVHHIVAIADGGAIFDLENLESLCVPCHNRKESLRRMCNSNKGGGICGFKPPGHPKRITRCAKIRKSGIGANRFLETIR